MPGKIEVAVRTVASAATVRVNPPIVPVRRPPMCTWPLARVRTRGVGHAWRLERGEAKVSRAASHQAVRSVAITFGALPRRFSGRFQSPVALGTMTLGCYVSYHFLAGKLQ